MFDIESEAVREHLEHLGQLPQSLVDTMKKRGLKIVVGNDENVLDLLSKSKIKGVRASLTRLVAKHYTTIVDWRDWEGKGHFSKIIPSGYFRLLKTAFAGGYEQHGSSSLVLHEYGHGFGHLFGLNGDSNVNEAHKRLFPKLSLYLRQDKPGSYFGRDELIAESFAGYFMLSREEFISRYDESWHSFLKGKIEDVSKPK